MVITDEDIKKAIIDQLYWDARVDASDIIVAVDNGIVTLEGTVPTALARDAAVQSARAVAGVVDVGAAISIRYGETESDVSDAAVRDRVASVLSWSADVDASDVLVAVDGGVVTLEGSVDAYWKRHRVDELVSGVRGVRSVENKLSVVPTKDTIDQTIADDIIAALERHLLVDPKAIEVKVSGGVVTLSGRVPSWEARQAAYGAALYTLGVRDVIADLQVTG